MKLGILSDVHGNLPALEACLNVLSEENVNQILCLGDIVGYGPQPNECIDTLRNHNIPSLLGNHDAATINRISMKMFREPNASLLEWTRKNLTKENREYLQDCPLIITDDNWIAAHASPIKPERWTYLRSAMVCRNVLEQVDQPICFVGHTHMPGFVANEIGVFNVQKGYKYVINPGSVGQSRDEDPRASFGIFDFDAFSYKNYRVEYPVEDTLNELKHIGYDDKQAKRLLHIKKDRY